MHKLFLALTSIVCALTCCCLLFVKKWNKLFILYNFVLSIGFAVLGALLLCSAREELQPISEPTPKVCRALVCSQPKRTKSTWQTNAVIFDGNYHGQVVRLSLLEKNDTSGRTIDIGDALLLSQPIHELRKQHNPGEFDFSTYLRRQGIAGETFCAEKNWQILSKALSKNLEKHLSPWKRIKLKALKARSSLVDKYEEHLEGRALAIVAAISLGDRTRIDASTRLLFSQTGASHLLALSGLHISILFSIYGFFVTRLRRSYLTTQILLLFGVGLMWAFALLVGMPLSLVRAVIMFTTYQVLNTIFKGSPSINNLALAVLFILIADPMALFDVGLQLSCLAVFGILIFNPLFPQFKYLRKHRVAAFFYSLLTVTVSAQIGTMPVVAYYFHLIPLAGLFSSFIVVPLSYPILAGGLLFLLLPQVMQSWLAPILTFLVNAMEVVLKECSNLPLAVIEIRPTLFSTLLCYVCIALVIAYFHYRKVKYAAAFCIVLLACAGTEIYAHHPNRIKAQIVFYNQPGYPAIHYIASPEKSFILTKNGKADSTAFRFIKDTFWADKLKNQPIWIEGNCNHEIFLHHAPFVCFGEKTMVILDKPFWNLPKKYFSTVDILFITRGAKGDLSNVLKSFCPKLLVLDASLSGNYRKLYKAEAQKANVACHDINTQGTLIIYLDDNNECHKNP